MKNKYGINYDKKIGADNLPTVIGYVDRGDFSIVVLKKRWETDMDFTKEEVYISLKLYRTAFNKILIFDTDTDKHYREQIEAFIEHLELVRKNISPKSIEMMYLKMVITSVQNRHDNLRKEIFDEIKKIYPKLDKLSK